MATFPSSEYEQDPRWTAVDTYTLSHLHPTSRPNHATLSQTLAHSRASGLPAISAFPCMAKFLALQCRLLRATHALEVGTLGGYTAIWLASENPGLHVTSIEYDRRHVQVARENIRAAGLEDRVEVIEGAGLEVLPRLLEEVQAGKRARFEFAFVDADKVNNWAYFDLAVKMCRSGACVVVDNIVRNGKLVDGGKRETKGVKGAREVVEKAGMDERVDAVVMQTVAEKNYDGFLMGVVR